MIFTTYSELSDVKYFFLHLYSNYKCHKTLNSGHETLGQRKHPGEIPDPNRLFMFFYKNSKINILVLYP